MNNLCLLLTLLHIVVLGYLSAKSVYYQFVNDHNTDSNDGSYYLPRILESYPHPEDFYAFVTYLNLYSLFLRLYSTKELVKQSVKNRNGYVNVKITQINISSLAFVRLTIRDRISLFVSGPGHKK